MTDCKIDHTKEELASELRGSFLAFCRFFFKYVTQKDFIISQPIGRESHHISVARALTNIFREQQPAQGFAIEMPPGHGKSIFVSMWVAWCYAHYPDCNFLYISYSHTLAASHTAFIKRVMTSKMYQYLFDVTLTSDTRSKDHFQTEAGGHVAAFGSSGAITGRDAGLPGLFRFSGAVLIDDPIKPDEAHSEKIRKTVKRNYQETILQRPRDINVPIIYIGQRLHEDDLAAYFKSGEDVRTWESLTLKGLDDAGNALYPEMQPKEYLLELQEKQPYVFASQIQQDPMPAGGALFKKDYFVILDKEPEMLATFITADTAETDKTYNDATAFSFWGVYEIESMGRKTGELGLHWLDAVELYIEPKDLRDEFLNFWQECMRHPCTPRIAAIEKKSTGVTLVSTLKELRTITIRPIERTRASGSKTTRFIETQSQAASKLISFTEGARHAKMCIDHMSKITANDTHRRDDLADTYADAVKIALIDKLIYTLDSDERKTSKLSQILHQQHVSQQRLGRARNDANRSKLYR